MLKQYTFLALALVGCAMLILDRDTNRIGTTTSFVWVAEHPQACRRTTLPAVPDAQVMATVRASELKCRVAELKAHLRASIARLQAEKACWLNNFSQKLQGKHRVASSPAWRDVQYDAQQLAKIFGFCKSEPV